MSPKFINGSFAALFDHVDVVAEYARHITRSRTDDLNGSPIRMSPRRRLEDRPRQYSLDHSFRLQSAAGRQSVVRRLDARQGSLDSKIEEIFQGPPDEDQAYKEDGAENEKLEDAGDQKGDKDFYKLGDKQKNDASLNEVEGGKFCKHCGKPLDD